MKKLVFSAATALMWVLVTATTALGQSELPPNGNPPVQGEVVTPPDGGTAFTGADLGIWLVAIAALVVVGAVLFVAGRRRAASVG